MVQAAQQGLDLIDRKILAELDRNARTGYSELGKKIRIAKETVKYRIRQLEKRGIIRGYYTVLNLPKLGFTIYRLYLRLHNTSPKIEKELTNYLNDSEKVAVFYRTTGPFHIALGVWARDIWEYEEFWLGLKARFGEYISDRHLSLMSEYLEFSRAYLHPSKDGGKLVFTTVGHDEPEKLDGLDLKLLAFLSNRARAPLVGMARALGTSLVTVRHHLKRLKDRKVIVGFRPILDLAKLGKEYYKVDLWLRKFDCTDEIRSYIISQPEVTYTERTLVSGDIEFDVEIGNFDAFIAFMDSVRAKFPQDIRDYEYYSRVRNHKTSYMPNLK